MNKEKKNVIIYTDGACLGNPGNGGWGAVLICGDNKKEIYGSHKDTTNNRMEIMAVIKSIQAIKFPCNIEIYTDSSYVKNGITSWIHNWKKNNWKTAKNKPVKNSDLWQLLDQVLGEHKISWHWVKGHNGNEFNEMADKLASKGAKEA